MFLICISFFGCLGRIQIVESSFLKIMYRANVIGSNAVFKFVCICKYKLMSYRVGGNDCFHQDVHCQKMIKGPQVQNIETNDAT